ncbi:MAG TPA: hypothetical protein PLM53_05935 [Spirochaetota bacterium]|nr:hypothetical protein [Spirochaetota bacterium]HPC43245.1 hypothetical protein [Spirochaetota bacterium]HPL19118.1 hypothetical protein [Spirochaetota bacterium]HQF10523.1 hypothetical protein [Spirochaetota bacterium]HQH96621.1 hypothetical protein [Spirochaetota bacterium]
MMSLKYLRKILVIIFLAASAVFMSCDMFKDTENYDINIMIICSGTGSQQFTSTFMVDDRALLPYPLQTGFTFYPAGKISAATITATRADSTDTLIIMVYKNGKVDEKGYAVLQSCNTSSTSTYCSDTATLVYKVTDDNKTESAAGSSSSSSSSSTSTSSSSSTTSGG